MNAKEKIISILINAEPTYGYVGLDKEKIDLGKYESMGSLKRQLNYSSSTILSACKELVLEGRIKIVFKKPLLIHLI